MNAFTSSGVIGRFFLLVAQSVAFRLASLAGALLLRLAGRRLGFVPSVPEAQGARKPRRVKRGLVFGERLRVGRRKGPLVPSYRIVFGDLRASGQVLPLASPAGDD